MTTPSLMKSFDTSLVDTQRSWSSTETMTSGSNTSQKENQSPPVSQTQAALPRRDVTNAELYEQWAPTYDSDGNVLQAIDDMKTRTSIPELVEILQRNIEITDDDKERPINIVDFGCGTGRSTLKLMQCRWASPVVINAWDGSLSMLNFAKAKGSQILRTPTNSQEVHESLDNISTDFRLVDFSLPSQLPSGFIGQVDGLISTLVLEHLPLEVYWRCIAGLLRPGGRGLMSNMHPEMGSGSVAGFKDEEGTRVSGRSFVHGVEETAEAARRVGLEVWDVEEEAVDNHMIEEGVVGERGRKWVGRKIWYGMKFKKPVLEE